MTRRPETATAKTLVSTPPSSSHPSPNTEEHAAAEIGGPPSPRMLIDGHWVSAASEETYTSFNPATGEAIGEVAAGSRMDARRAVDAASAALLAWSRLPAVRRGRILHDVGDLVMQRQESLARLVTMEEGKPLAEARNEIAFSADFLHWFAEEGRRAYGAWIPDPQPDRRLLTIRQPIGVVAAITPWNVPASMIARKAAPALAAGCTVVLKPAPQTSLTGLAMTAAFHDAGVPPGVINVVTGEAVPIGEAWLADGRVRKVSFTGSTEVGRLLARGSAEHLKRVSLELGGNAPFIVFADADMDAVIAGLTGAKFRNCGQTCVSANRIYAQATVADEVADRLAALARELRVGDGLLDGTQIGPLIDDAALAKVTRAVSDAVEGGARALVGGHRMTGGGCARGNFYAPTVLADVTDAMRLVREESFGPIAPVIPFGSEREVVEAANATNYGLASYLYTNDLERAIRVAESLQYGMVGINDQRISTSEAPFGGMKHSGIGREGGREGLAEFLETKLIAIHVQRGSLGE